MVASDQIGPAAGDKAPEVHQISGATDMADGKKHAASGATLEELESMKAEQNAASKPTDSLANAQHSLAGSHDNANSETRPPHYIEDASSASYKATEKAPRVDERPPEHQASTGINAKAQNLAESQLESKSQTPYLQLNGDALAEHGRELDAPKTNHVDHLPDLNHMYVSKKMQAAAEASLGHRFTKLLSASDSAEGDDDKSFYEDNIPDLSRASTIRKTVYPHHIEAAAGQIPLADRSVLSKAEMKKPEVHADERIVAVNGSRFAEDLPRTPSQRSNVTRKSGVKAALADPHIQNHNLLSLKDQQRHQQAEHTLIAAAPPQPGTTSFPPQKLPSPAEDDPTGFAMGMSSIYTSCAILTGKLDHIGGNEHRHRALRAIYGQPPSLDNQRASPARHSRRSIASPSRRYNNAADGNLPHSSMVSITPQSSILRSQPSLHSYAASRVSIIAPSVKPSSTRRPSVRTNSSRVLPSNPLYDRRPPGRPSSVPESPWRVNRSSMQPSANSYSTAQNGDRPLSRANSTRTARTYTLRDHNLSRTHSLYSQGHYRRAPAVQIHQIDEEPIAADSKVSLSGRSRHLYQA